MAGDVEWVNALTKVGERVVKVETPKGSGTGFVIAPPDKNGVIGIATALHVIGHATTWLQPIRLTNVEEKTSVMLVPPRFSVHYNDTRDLALIRTAQKLSLPATELPVIGEGNRLMAGTEIGWCGYPAVAPSDTLCFFSGRISAWWGDEAAYLVDGVAINGVSGGPAFTCDGDHVELVGVVTAYIPNRATGEALPGVSLVRAVNPFLALFKKLEGKPTEGGGEVKDDPKPPPEQAPPPTQPS